LERKQHAPEFKAKVALEALKGDATTAESASRFWAHQTMIHQLKRALLKGASSAFECGGQKKPELDEEQVKDAARQDREAGGGQPFLKRKLKPWVGT
jgi:transposase